MARRYRRTARTSKRTRYSVENVGVSITTGASALNGLFQNGQTIIPATDVQGTRAVKHLTISMSQDTGDTRPVWWALIFVPQGYQANALFPYYAESQLQGSMYEPNQFVMGCGYIDPNAGPIRIRSNVSRNLQSGDSVALVIGNTETPSNLYRGVVTYAVAYK